jgi:hypothetical protein
MVQRKDRQGLKKPSLVIMSLMRCGSFISCYAGNFTDLSCIDFKTIELVQKSDEKVHNQGVVKKRGVKKVKVVSKTKDRKLRK